MRVYWEVELHYRWEHSGNYGIEHRKHFETVTEAVRAYLKVTGTGHGLTYRLVREDGTPLIVVHSPGFGPDQLLEWSPTYVRGVHP